MTEIPFTAPTMETADFHVSRAAWCALGWGALNVVLAILAFAEIELPLGFGRLSLAEGIPLLLLGHGMMIRNRVVAVALVPVWLGMFAFTSFESLAVLPVRIVFLYFFSTGAWSVFLHHKQVAEMGGPED